jgi:hypothetical protein
MLRCALLKAGLALVILPLLRFVERDPPANEVMVPPEWEVLIARARTHPEDWTITDAEYANATLGACERI